VIVRIGYIDTSEQFQIPSLLVNALLDTSEHDRQPMRWASRNQRCSQSPYNNDFDIVLRLSDVCPTKDTTFTVVVGTLDVQVVEIGWVEIDLYLNFGVYTSGAVSHICVSHDYFTLL